MLAPLMLVPIMLLAEPPTVLRPPRWSWDTLGSMAFLHAGDPQTYTADEVALNRFVRGSEAPALRCVRHVDTKH